MRKSISKKKRFEVFKRDKFTCQYCGAKAPDVILELDHIKPVSKGGKNDLLNLVTSCFECNRGKSNRTLSDDSFVKKMMNQAEFLQERRNQLEMIAEWQEEISRQMDIEVSIIENAWFCTKKYTFSDYARNKIISMIKRFGMRLIVDSIPIAKLTYQDMDTAFNKLGGICYNRKYRDKE